MKPDIVRFIRELKIKFNVEAFYFAYSDVYSIRYKGKGVQNFNSKNFYEIPRRFRQNMIRALIKVGLNHNYGEKVGPQLTLNRSVGKKI